MLCFLVMEECLSLQEPTLRTLPGSRFMTQDSQYTCLLLGLPMDATQIVLLVGEQTSIVCTYRPSKPLLMYLPFQILPFAPVLGNEVNQIICALRLQAQVLEFSRVVVQSP
jgi:hypothetical protein